ncbi:hypothetical protein CKAH01_02554 [Colletotrichum kahawae]|uniref:Uncharacterized protein n=1 Tax=Colletotrichum kahawae TaxID=34407 RepID=A0AAD9XY56_COLKA|nr:hypothetical protein CKAH01_02554 [Colletotrichum kahawae]
MRHAVGGLLLHLGEHIADDLGVVVGCALGAGDVDGDIAELGPREGVVEVVLEEVVLGQVLEVGVLYEGEVGGLEEADIHGGRVSLFFVSRREVRYGDVEGGSEAAEFELDFVVRGGRQLSREAGVGGVRGGVG